MASSEDGPKYVDWESLSAKDQRLINPNQTVLDTEAPLTPETKEVKVEINKETEREAFELARDSMIPDPFDKNRKEPHQISLLSFLGREFVGSYYARAHQPNGDLDMNVIARTVVSRMGSLEAIRSLAEACRSEIHTEDLQERLRQKKLELDELYDQPNDYANQPKALALKKEIADLYEQITINERTGNEMYHYLHELADEIEAQPGAWERLGGV